MVKVAMAALAGLCIFAGFANAKAGTSTTTRATLDDIQESSDVRLIYEGSVAPIGRDRAAAVAGYPVTRVAIVGFDENEALEDVLEDRGLCFDDVVAIYLDSRGVFWVYFDKD